MRSAIASHHHNLPNSYVTDDIAWAIPLQVTSLT